jgi:hypothetical protein
MNFRSHSELLGVFLLGLSGVVLFVSFSLFPLAVILFCLAMVCMLQTIVSYAVFIEGSRRRLRPSVCVAGGDLLAGWF